MPNQYKNLANRNVLLATALSLSSVVFLSKIGFSPVYPLCFFFSIAAIVLFRLKLSFNEFFLFTTSFIFVLFTLANNILKVGESPYLMPIIVNLTLSPLIMLACFGIYKKLSIAQLSLVIWFFIYFVIMMASIDSIWKIFNPLVNPMYELEGSDIWFYKYKNSLMFGDSNGTAILLLTTLGLYLASIKLKVIKQRRMIFMVLTVLLILTLSRAAIFSTFIAVSLFYAPKNKFFIMLLASLVLTLFLIYIPYIYEVFESDGSGITKLNELFHIKEFLLSSTIQEFFQGVGYGLGERETGRYIHGILPKLIIEGGVLSFLLFSFFIIFALVIYKASIYLYIPLLICSISLSLYLIVPFQVVVFCLISRASTIANFNGENK